MLLIWRGWGILPVLYLVAALILTGLLVSLGLPQSSFGIVFFGLGLLAAVATWFTGVAINQNRPRRKAAEWAQHRRAQLNELVVSGRFSLGPGQPQPASLEEAQRMSDDLFAAETAELDKAVRNRHTLFWIPMQYVAFVLAAFVLWCLVEPFIAGPRS